jgi:hypothetical protein
VWRRAEDRRGVDACAGWRRPASAEPASTRGLRTGGDHHSFGSAVLGPRGGEVIGRGCLLVPREARPEDSET